MSVFGNYARFYDLLYRDKNYAAEAQYVHKLIQSYAPGAKSILELGCGTGAHAAFFASEGYSVHGVEISRDMLKQAESRLTVMLPEQVSRLKFSLGDIRTVRIDHKFDAVMALFHVISYQTTNDDLRAAFATAKAHLKSNGILVFDCWYGPAVLSDRPTVRVKRMEDDKFVITRIAEPEMQPNDNCVTVNYQIFVKHKISGKVEEFHECHRMRYLFMPEIKDLFASMECKMISSQEWVSNREPGFNSWNICCVGR